MAHVKTLRETVLAALTDCSTVLRYDNRENVCTRIDILFDIILHRQGSGGSQHLQQLLLCMPCIRQVDSSLRRFWALIRRESRVPMNKLFLEMLESPMRWSWKKLYTFYWRKKNPSLSRFFCAFCHNHGVIFFLSRYFLQKHTQNYCYYTYLVSLSLSDVYGAILEHTHSDALVLTCCVFLSFNNCKT